jgi:hypothetical protein
MDWNFPVHVNYQWNSSDNQQVGTIFYVLITMGSNYQFCAALGVVMNVFQYNSICIHLFQSLL